jgi:hypothetical protein
LNYCCFVYAGLYENTHNVVTCVNMYCFNVRLLYFFYTSTHNVITFFCTDVYSSETESDIEKWKWIWFWYCRNPKTTCAISSFNMPIIPHSYARYAPSQNASDDSTSTTNDISIDRIRDNLVTTTLASRS